jgi:hypothetical protein
MYWQRYTSCLPRSPAVTIPPTPSKSHGRCHFFEGDDVFLACIHFDDFPKLIRPLLRRGGLMPVYIGSVKTNIALSTNKLYSYSKLCLRDTDKIVSFACVN